MWNIDTKIKLNKPLFLKRILENYEDFDWYRQFPVFLQNSLLAKFHYIQNLYKTCLF